MKALLRSRWAFVAVGLLLFSVGTQAVLITLSISDIPTDLREVDERVDASSQALGWTVRIEGEPGMLSVEAFNRYGKPIRHAAVTVEATHASAGGATVKHALPMVGDGVYAAEAAQLVSGAWRGEVVIATEKAVGRRRVAFVVPQAVSSMNRSAGEKGLASR